MEMEQDYYDSLSLPLNATDADIKKAYRTFALKYHPRRNPNPEAEEKFRQATEAYDVLSNAPLRARYNRFGADGLKRGVPTWCDGGFTAGYLFHGDHQKVFEEFFARNYPFLELDESSPYEMENRFGGLKGRGRRKQDASIEQDLYLTLEEIFNGCTKKIAFTKRVMNEDGCTTRVVEKILDVCVQPGWRAGTRITFPGEGDEGPNRAPADVVFVVKEEPHSTFKRNKDDIIYTAKVPLSDALTGFMVDVPTLDEKVITVPVNDVVSPGYRKMIPGEGMPVPKQPGSRGNLVVDFDIEFPKRMPEEERKTRLREALSFVS